ncbi:YihY/virulence factor BrkB family protein [Cytophagaceae bacterium ABcell3]|nr:YihY/virulence factor BrkB family protein [Cytophagaceae bacterium ABcell3]
MQLLSFKQWIKIFKETAEEFQNDNTFHYAAALSYYTIFSLPPIIIIVITVSGAILGEEAVKGELFASLDNLLGPESAQQIKEMTDKAAGLHSTRIAQIVGGLTLMITSTGVFVSLQSALNIIWKVKSKPKNNLLKMAKDRILSFSMILTIGFLLLVSFLIHAIIIGFSAILDKMLGHATFVILQIIDLVLPLFITTVLFGLIFKVLPDVQIRWKEVWAGALFTAVLFTLGEFLISIYMSHANVLSAYGAAGTVLLILTWVFYSSNILFFGAEFTKVYARTIGQEIKPAPYALRLETKIVDNTHTVETQKNVTNI